MNGMAFAQLTDPAKIRSHLVDHPQTLVLWNGEESELVRQTEETLIQFSTPNRVFVITDGAVSEYAHVVATRAFGHHLYRKYDRAAPMICSRLIDAALTPYPFGLPRFFPPNTQVQKIVLKKSSQKAAAVGAVQNYLVKLDIHSRLASLAAQATDELIMNAVFDAAVFNGHQTRRSMDRATDIELFDREEVSVEVATTEDYIGIAVADQYGSLKKEVVHHFIGIDYGSQSYVPTPGKEGSGLGLYGIIQAGLSMIFVAKPGMRTEVMVFFPRVSNYKQFRTGFRFLSILSQ